MRLSSYRSGLLHFRSSIGQRASRIGSWCCPLPSSPRLTYSAIGEGSEKVMDSDVTGVTISPPWMAAGHRVRCGGGHRDSEAQSMSTFKWPLRISSMDGQRMRDIEAIVGTGVMFTTLPDSLLRELGIEPRGRRKSSAGRWTTCLPGLRAGVGYDRRRERNHPGGLRRRRCPRPAGDLHSYRSGSGGRSHRTATGSHASHPVLVVQHPRVEG